MGNERAESDADWGDTTSVDWVVATTDLVHKYTPPERLSVEALGQLAEQLLRNETPMFLEHDPTRPFRARCSAAIVRERADGAHELLATFEVSTEDLTAFLGLVEESGGPGGFSYSRSERMGVVDAVGDHRSDQPYPLTFVADASLEEGVIRDAAVEIAHRLQMRTAVERSYSYSAEEIVGLTLYVAQSVALGALGSGTWAGVAGIFNQRKGRLTSFSIDRTSPDGANLVASFTTRDPEVAQAALLQLSDLAAQDSPRAVFRDEIGEWDWPTRRRGDD